MKTTLIAIVALMTGCAAQVAPTTHSTATTADALDTECTVPAEVTPSAVDLEQMAKGLTLIVPQADGTRWEMAPGGYLLHSTDAGSEPGDLLCVRGQGNVVLFRRSACK